MDGELWDCKQNVDERKKRTAENKDRDRTCPTTQIGPT